MFFRAIRQRAEGVSMSSYEAVNFTTTNSLLSHIFVFLSRLLGQTRCEYSVKLSN
jgi:hypothetical protein